MKMVEILREYKIPARVAVSDSAFVTQICCDGLRLYISLRVSEKYF
jgi:hypothetical protein